MKNKRQGKRQSPLPSWNSCCRKKSLLLRSLFEFLLSLVSNAWASCCSCTYVTKVWVISQSSTTFLHVATRFGKAYREICVLLCSILTLEDGTDWLSRNVGNCRLRCVKYQKSADPIYTAAEAWDDARPYHHDLNARSLHRWFNFWARSQNCRKWLLVSFVMSVYLSAWNNSARAGRIFMKSDILIFWRICLENSSCFKIWQK